MLVLSNEEIDRLLDMPACIDALAAVYGDYFRGDALNSVRGENLAPSGRADAHYVFKHMGGTWPARGVHALRINSDVIAYPTVGGVGRRVKVPAAGGRWVGLVQLFSIETGELLALFPDGVLQRNRVAATSGLAAKHLARRDAVRVALIGSGWQAQGQLAAIAAVRPIESVRVYSPNEDNRNAFVRRMRGEVEAAIEGVASAEDCVREADIIIAATSSTVPVLQPHWLEPGTHLSTIRTEEVDARVLERCARVVVHVRNDGQVDPLIAPGTPGVEHHNTNLASQRGNVGGGGQAWAGYPELAELVGGKAPGRSSAGEVSCFVNNVGLGIQFVALAALVHEKARAAGVGRELPGDWFTQDVHP